MRVGIVGDIHEPFTHPLYREFYLDTAESWNVTRHVLIGDVVDHHAISFHEHDPNGRSAEDEASAAELGVRAWYEAIPRAKVCIGNHDERNYRTARKAGLPDRYLKSHREVWDTPRWHWDYEHIIEGVLYTHGTGVSGKDAALNLAIQKRMPTVIGHVHSWGGVKYHANPTSRVFGMNAGCGIDIDAYAFAYGKSFPIRPVLGCGIVIDGRSAIFEVMPCGLGERYHRSRAGKRRRKQLA